MFYAGVFFIGGASAAAEKQATGFSNRQFLGLAAAHQKFWIQGAMNMLVHVAASKEQATGQCVADWYFGDKRAKRNGLILASMEKYPDIHPSSIMLALAERACGTFRN